MLRKLEYVNQSLSPSLMVVHGLYGSARNWGVVCRKLSQARGVVAVDNRNHGESDWSETHSYFDLAQDLAQEVEAFGAPMDILGHSMGGKAAMTLALTRPDLVRRLIVADIAPVTYTHSQLPFIHAMRQVDLSAV
ncbi:MAG: alpha/beta fold hydrolase, partial [Cognatishimia sp.]|uniref:alpha/beta fold hydrolase n=1 Tax=Cognatishimia sp. TaxID=2211648 RepID=UPI0040597D0E